MASLRFSGLDVDAVCESLLPSPPNLDKAWFTGPCPSKLKVSRDDLSKLLRSFGLLLPLFSWPPATLEFDACIEFPLSETRVSTRFIGLLSEFLVRDEQIVGAVLVRDDDRSANLALGGNGTAKGDELC